MAISKRSGLAMHTVDLIANALGEDERTPLPCATEGGTCCLTGNVCECIPRKKLFGKSFTQGNVFSCPGSNFVGVNAWYALKYKWQRMSLWLVDEKTFVRPDRAQVREWVLHGVDADTWAAFVTTSYKKHGFQAPVNCGRYGLWLFDELTIDCRDNTWITETFTGMCEFQKRGVSRPLMESLTASPYVIAKIGLKTWDEFLAFAKPLTGRRWKFLCYLLPSKKEIENEGCVAGS